MEKRRRRGRRRRGGGEEREVGEEVGREDVCRYRKRRRGIESLLLFILKSGITGHSGHSLDIKQPY